MEAMQGQVAAEFEIDRLNRRIAALIVALMRRIQTENGCEATGRACADGAKCGCALAMQAEVKR